MKILWCMVPEIWSTIDRILAILGHFCPFTPLTNWKTKILKKWKKPWDISFYTCVQQMTIIWCTAPEIWSTTDRIFCHFEKKMKKNPGDIIISHLCNTNDNHMMYSFWDMEEDRHNFLSFWTSFCHFTPLTTQEIQKIRIMKKWKKHLEISFYNINENHMINGSWDMKHDRQNFLSFWASFCPFTPPTSEKIKIMKK